MTVYKVVRRNGSAYKSAIIDTVGLCLHYDIGHTTSAPEGTKILAFDCESNARSWRNNGYETRVILKCETCDCPVPIYTLGPLHWTISMIMQLWAKLVCGHGQAPNGTIGVGSLTPVAEI